MPSLISFILLNECFLFILIAVLYAHIPVRALLCKPWIDSTFIQILVFLGGIPFPYRLGITVIFLGQVKIELNIPRRT